MKITRPQHAFADVQVPGQNAEVLWPGVGVGGIAHAGLQFAEEHGVAPAGFEREQLHPGAAHGEFLPASGFVAGDEAKSLG